MKQFEKLNETLEVKLKDPVFDFAVLDVAVHLLREQHGGRTAEDVIARLPTRPAAVALGIDVDPAPSAQGDVRRFRRAVN